MVVISPSATREALGQEDRDRACATLVRAQQGKTGVAGVALRSQPDDQLVSGHLHQQSAADGAADDYGEVLAVPPPRQKTVSARRSGIVARCRGRLSLKSVVRTRVAANRGRCGALDGMSLVVARGAIFTDRSS